MWSNAGPVGEVIAFSALQSVPEAGPWIEGDDGRNLGRVLQMPDVGHLPELSQQTRHLPATLSVGQNRV